MKQKGVSHPPLIKIEMTKVIFILHVYFNLLYSVS